MIEKAKLDGTYFLSDNAENLILPEELKQEFLKQNSAELLYNLLPPKQKFRIIYKISLLKTPKARIAKSLKIINMLLNWEIPENNHHFEF